MNEAVAQRTRETLGQVIHKPPLTDALLSKPPFRYLHDLISEVIRATGFLKGLYTDSELNSDNVKDKNSKMNFLQKAIDVVVLVTGEPLSVKPARVVAGYEPEKTNEFLQAIGKCCLNKLSSDAAVKRVLAGERADPAVKSPSSKPRDKESRESKAEEPKNQGDKEGRRDTGIKERSSNRPGKPRGDVKEGREREKEGDEQKDNKERHKDPETDTGREEGKQERERSKSRTTKQGRDPEKSKGKGDREKDLEHDKVQERERRYEGGREKDRLKGRDKDKARDREGVRGRDGDRPRDREKDEEHLQERKKKAERKLPDSEESTLTKTQRPTRDSKCQPDNENGSPARISRQPSVKGSRHHSKTRGEGTVDTRSGADGIPQDIGAELQEKTDSRSAEKQKVGEVENVASEKPGVSEGGEVPQDLPPQPTQRRIPGPGSARPAPPRVKRQESTEISIPERSGSAKTTPNVILEQQVPEEEDEQFVVEAAGPLPQMEPEVELVEDQKHGGLIKRILETKKDYEASQMTDREHHIVLGPSRKRERDLVAREVQKCQVAIQTVCRHAAAFGRILDCIQEDMDAMKNELHMWKQENKQLEEALRREQSITDSALQPLKAELAELDQLIKDEQDKIRAVKANILRNNEKIDRMIRSINASSRK